MRWQIRRCPECREYTLRELCPRCNVETHSPIPPKFSPLDRYARYRIPQLNAHEDLHSRRKE